MKPFILHFVIISAALLFRPYMDCFSQQSYSTQVKTVVLDAGHGGDDPGTTHGGVKEKDVVLKIAFKTGELIKKAHPDVNVVYTRKTDVKIPLDKRGKIANDAKADLFISIHVNAQEKGTTAKGISTYVMGNDKSKNNLTVAQRENDVIIYEDDYQTRYQGYKAGSPELFVIFSLMQYVYQEQSITFADILQKHYKKNTNFADRGAKEGPFLVLWATAMPSVLTEAGFMTNPDDRKYVNSDAGQNAIAKSICEAFTEYKNKIEKNSTVSNSGIIREQKETPTQAVAGDNSGDIKYRIQVAASSRKMNTLSSSQFGSYRNKVTEMVVDGLYKYYVEETSSYQDAVSLQKKTREKFKDAFIVAFKNGERVAITDEMKRN